MKYIKCFSALIIIAMVLAACAPAAPAATTAPAAPAATVAPAPVTQATTSAQDPAFTSDYSKALLADAATLVDVSKYKKAGPYVIAVSAQDPSNGWGLTFDVSVKAEGAELLADGTLSKPLITAFTNDANQQISNIEDLLQQKPDAMVIEPQSRSASVAVIKQVVDAGIPVVLCANGIEGEDFTSRVDVNLYEIAYRSIQGLAKILGNKGNIIMLNGIAGVDFSETTRQAALDALKNYPDIKVVAEDYAQFDTATAKQKTDAMMAAHPQIDGVWAGGGAMAVGAAEAFLDANKPAPAFGVLDIPNGFLRLAKENNYKFVAYPQPGGMSSYCLKAAVDILQGKPVTKFVNLNTLMPGAGGYDSSNFLPYYIPDLNDDVNTPITVDEKYYIQGGFARK